MTKQLILALALFATLSFPSAAQQSLFGGTEV
jgi:hypothetical protein